MQVICPTWQVSSSRVFSWQVFSWQVFLKPSGDSAADL
jgi:hypothetical protein